METREILTAERVWELLDNAVADRGADYVYPKQDDLPYGNVCLYWHPGDNDGAGGPGCIVGHVLTQLGVDPDTLQQHEGDSAFHLLMEDEVYPTTLEAARILSDVQRRQDEGFSWGEAVTSARSSRVNR